MVLFVSDIHLGRGTPAENRDAETALVACLDHYTPNLTQLYLLGDVFEQFMEYRYLIPKGATRLLGRLAQLADAGLPITYVVGNRDPWHRNYFEDELGIRVVYDYLQVSHLGHKLYLRHGDGADAKAWLYRVLKPVMRHTAILALYQYLTPGDAGFALAATFSKVKRDDSFQLPTIQGLRKHAEAILSQTEAQVVVMGHSHYASLEPIHNGAYLNTGFWFLDRTYGVLDQNKLELRTWQHQQPLIRTTYHLQPAIVTT